MGDNVSYSTIPPIFIIKLVEFIKQAGEPFITDHYVYGRHPERRGYTESSLGCPVLEAAGHWASTFIRRTWTSGALSTSTSPG